MDYSDIARFGSNHALFAKYELQSYLSRLSDENYDLFMESLGPRELYARLVMENCEDSTLVL